MTSKSPGVQQRLHLLHANRDAVSVMLARASAGGLSPEDAVVIIADQRDRIGIDLAKAAAEKAGLDANEEGERIQRRGEIPTAIIVVPLAGARTLFADSHPEVTHGLVRFPAASQVRIVVIAESAAMLIHAEFSLRTGMPRGS